MSYWISRKYTSAEDEFYSKEISKRVKPLVFFSVPSWLVSLFLSFVSALEVSYIY